HETWEFLKLRPLVVNGADGAVDFDRLFDALHVISPCYAPDKSRLLQVAFRRHALCISVLADTRTFDSNQCFPHKGHSAAAAAEWHTFFCALHSGHVTCNVRVPHEPVSTRRAAMQMQQLKELLLQSLEHERAGVEVYETAIRCAVSEDLKHQWSEYLEQTHTHAALL